MWRMSSVAPALSYRTMRPSAYRTLLRSQRPSLHRAGIRPPRPPAPNAAAPRPGSRPAASREQHLGAFEVKAEAHFLEPGLPHRLAYRPMLLGVEEQKPAAAGADELAADRPGLPAALVPRVDLRVAHAL